jgi:hypothetical protein
MSSWIEWFGMVASVIVAISLTLKNIKRLRIINMVGSLAFTIYGGLIGSYPVLILNGFIVLVNAFYLYRMAQDSKRPERFDILFVHPQTDEYAQLFLKFYSADIQRFFPRFSNDPVTGTLRDAEGCFILRETLPVSFVAFRREGNGEISILLDYAVPAYRDLKNARFFFETAAAKIASPQTVFSAVAEVGAHESYLRKMGFREVGREGSAILFKK